MLRFFLLALCVLLGGCAAEERAKNQPPDERDVPDVVDTEFTENIGYLAVGSAISYGQEETARVFSLSLRNDCGETVLVVAEGRPAHSFTVLSENTTVWSWPEEAVDIIEEFTLEGGETRTFEQDWNGRNNDYKPVGEGIYTLRAGLDGGIKDREFGEAEIVLEFAY